MRIIRCGVRCQSWNEPRHFDVEVEDDATEEEIAEEIRSAANEEAGFDYRREDGAPSAPDAPAQG